MPLQPPGLSATLSAGGGSLRSCGKPSRSRRREAPTNLMIVPISKASPALAVQFKQLQATPVQAAPFCYGRFLPAAEHSQKAAISGHALAAAFEARVATASNSIGALVS